MEHFIPLSSSSNHFILQYSPFFFYLVSIITKSTSMQFHHIPLTHSTYSFYSITFYNLPSCLLIPLWILYIYLDVSMMSLS